MKKINFENLPSKNTPVSATNVNQLQSNIEEVFNGNEAMGSIVVDDIKCKNLLDKNNVNFIKCQLTSSTLSSNTGCTCLYIPIQSNTIYTVSRQAIGARFAIAFSTDVPADGVTVYSRKGNNSASSLTTDNSGDNKYLVVWFHNSSADTLTMQELLDGLMIEKGPVATDYVPYKNFSCTPIIQEASASDFTLATGYGGSNLCKVTAEKDGYAIATTFVSFAGNNTGLRQLYIRKNNTTISGAVSMRPPTNDAITLSVTEVFKCSKGDEITSFIKQTSGADMVISGNLRVLII